MMKSQELTSFKAAGAFNLLTVEKPLIKGRDLLPNDIGAGWTHTSEYTIIPVQHDNLLIQVWPVASFKAIKVPCYAFNYALLVHDMVKELLE